MDLNSVLIVTASTIVVGGFVAVAVCTKNSSKQPKIEEKSEGSTNTPAVVAATKPKKKRANKKPAKKGRVESDKQLIAENAEEEEEDEEEEVEVKKETKSDKKTDASAKTKTADLPALEKFSSSNAATKTAPAPVVKSSTPVPAPVKTPAPVSTPTPAPTPVAAEGGKKKKKDKDSKVDKSKLEVKAAVKIEEKSSDDFEDNEFLLPVSRPVSQPVTVPQTQTTSFAPSFSTSIPLSSEEQADGWAVVESGRKKQEKDKKKEEKESSEKKDDKEASEEKKDFVKSSISVDARKVGLVVGPKAVTLHQIQDLFSVEIITSKENKDSKDVKSDKKPSSSLAIVQSVILVSGPCEGVSGALKVISDLCTKGYSAALEDGDFKESSVSVHSMYVPEIVGKGGVVRKKLQDHTGVKVVVPPTDSRDSRDSLVKITLAGPKAKVTEAKALIHELTQFYHTEVTHPGFVHEEMDVPPALYNLIIGAKGAEIRHIENNFKVSVYIPNSDSVNKNLLVVGEAGPVSSACRYIQKKIDQAQEDKQAALIMSDIWQDKENSEEKEESWMKPYLNTSKASITGELLEGSEQVEVSFTSKPSQSSSWSSAVLASSDGW